jgi:AraC family transcriptional regulator of adaptative response/methylated-DNA-[protein]-cysteine methyltransferase
VGSAQSLPGCVAIENGTPLKWKNSCPIFGGRRRRLGYDRRMLAHDNDTLYAALLARDPAYDGHWYVGVSTTGIFCRLTCPARKPKREHSSFYRTSSEAEAAGFRACMRCRPLDSGRPANAVIEDLRRRVAARPDRRWGESELAALGHDVSTVRRLFKREYGVTFAQFARAQRLGAGVASLTAGAPVIEAQLDAGYDSASGFRDAIGRLLGQAPAKVRDRRMLIATWIDTPIGAILGVCGDAGVYLLEFADRTALPGELARLQARHGPVLFGAHSMLDRLAEQVGQYFSAAQARFDIPIAQPGSAFSKTVWAELQRVPAGETRSYKGLAEALGRPDAIRAVARANGVNQVALIVPCHRVIGSNGELVGYGGKLWRKRWLLEHEQRCAGSSRRH